MSYVDTLLKRNEVFAKENFVAGLKMLPSEKTMIIGCVDPRVDPVDVLGVKLGEAAIIRNIGGRINPGLLQTLGVLRVVSSTAGQEVGPGWNVIVLHHTHCGIVNCYQHSPQVLAKYLGVDEINLAGLSIEDPYRAVALDVDSLVKNPNLPKGAVVTGFVFDVETGKVKQVAGPLAIGAS